MPGWLNLVLQLEVVTDAVCALCDSYLLTYLLARLLIYLLTHSLTTWSRVLLEKLTVS
jgi:hypothetical protein